ncbi:MAG: hypothetical protein CYPHOPRED_004378 [Cyphobasidiales sp. Tagirdzhanova-0007]|nr:MAG: hypothetical protein CYPHOPRED_004378 [Cyphobasidiales sp. Tagirdzhanova-0007]
MRASTPLRALANPSSLFQSQHFYGNKSIAQLSNKAAYPISLKQMIAFGKDLTEERLLQSASFVRQELPVRIAHRVRDLQNLPFVVGLNPHLERVYASYLEAFECLRKIPVIRTLDENDAFCEILKSLLESHSATIPRIMTGLLESASHLPPAPRERIMNRMLRSRISRRVLSEQHIALTAQYHDLHEHGPISDGSRYIGIIDTRLCPFHTIKAIEVLLPLITGVHTELIVEGNKGVTIAFIDAHLKYVVLELVKNAVLAATKARRAEDAKKIYITIADSPKFLGVRVSDLSGGIAADRDMPMDLDGRPLHQASRSSLLSFSHPRQLAYIPVLRDSTRLAATIEEQVNTEANERLGLPGQRKELAMSLGLCKVYAEYFGGSLQLFTMDGLGSDAYLRIPKTGVPAAIT